MIRLLIIILLFSKAIYASESLNSTWLGLMNRHPLHNSFELWNEFQHRYSYESGKTHQILWRPGLLQRLDNKNEVGYLYSYIQTGLKKEQRLTFQWQWNHESAISNSRIRLERRHLENDEGDSWRLRYQFRTHKELKLSTQLVFWDEIFLNITRENWTGNRMLERNRAFLGLRQKIAVGQLEYGYLHTYVPRDYGDFYEHSLSLFLFY
jgi:hypothetical protein